MAVTRSQAKRSAARKAARKRSASPLGLTPLKQAKASKKGPDASQIYTPRDQSDASSVEEGLEWQRQFRRDKDLDSKLNGVGCGFYTLGGPWVPSQYPSPSEMMFEISTGMDKVSGCIKLRGPRNYWPDYQYKDLRDACFIVPAAHINQVIVLPERLALPRIAKHHQVIIVTADATGSSPLRQKYPQIISFSWPDKRADKGLDGRLVGEEPNGDQGTYLSLLRTAMDERLSPFQRSVLDITQRTDDELLHFPTALLYNTENPDLPEKIIPLNHAYFLDPGILFLSDSTRVYLPFGYFSDAMTIVMKDLATCKKMEWKTGDEPAVCFTVLMCVGEPYKRRDEGGKKGANADVGPSAESSPLLVELIRIPLCFLEKTEAYFGDHGIRVDKCEQVWYDFEKSIH